MTTRRLLALFLVLLALALLLVSQPPDAGVNKFTVSTILIEPSIMTATAEGE